MLLAEKCEIIPDITPRAKQRPPGAVSEVLMNDMCTGCGDCAAVCPAALILPDQDGYPLLLSASLCLQCGLCAEVCTPGAIQLTGATREGLERILAADHDRLQS